MNREENKNHEYGGSTHRNQHEAGGEPTDPFWAQKYEDPERQPEDGDGSSCHAVATCKDRPKPVDLLARELHV